MNTNVVLGHLLHWIALLALSILIGLIASEVMAHERSSLARSGLGRANVVEEYGVLQMQVQPYWEAVVYEGVE